MREPIDALVAAAVEERTLQKTQARNDFVDARRGQRANERAEFRLGYRRNLRHNHYAALWQIAFAIIEQDVARLFAALQIGSERTYHHRCDPRMIEHIVGHHHMWMRVFDGGRACDAIVVYGGGR